MQKTIKFGLTQFGTVQWLLPKTRIFQTVVCDQTRPQSWFGCEQVTAEMLSFSDGLCLY